MARFSANWSGAWLLGVSILLSSAGCKRAAPPPATAPVPATQAMATTAPQDASAASAPSSQPTSCLININGHMTLFPDARLRLESDGQHLVALLFSNDPKDALRDNYTGNSFYLRIDLDIDSPDKLADATWHYTAPSTGEADSDSPYGIYLGGRKMQLQPYDFLGRVKKSDDGLEVIFSGQFRILDDSIAHAGPAKMVPVIADVPVRVEGEQTAPKKPAI